MSFLAYSVTAILVVVVFLLWKFLFTTCVRSTKPTNYHVLITGGSSGIGLSLAECFRSFGAHVTLVARDGDKLHRAKSRLLESDGGDVHTLSLDLCEPFEHLQHTLDDHVAQYGPVDILINCAGYAVARTFLDTPPSALDQLIRTNYLSAVNVTKILLPHMLTNQARPSVDRRIAFVCSMAGQIGVYGLAAYTGSKYALRGFAEVLYMELEHSGPFVTLAFPPDTDTPGLAAENMGKPTATLEISSAGGLVSPEQVARTMYADIMAGKFISSFGLQGKALTMATAGLLPPLSGHSHLREGVLPMLANALMEVLLAGPLRAFGICYALFMRTIVRKHETSST